MANRLDRALEIAHGAHIITLSAGTTHKATQIDQSGSPVFESVAGARYLIRRGYPQELVLTETASYDTVGNAYFARTIHTDPKGFRKLTVVTSEFHVQRAEAIFQWIFGLTPIETPYELSFVSVPDVGLTDETLERRREKRVAQSGGDPEGD